MNIELDPAATALLIMDYQPATLGFLADPDAFVSPAATLANELRAAGGKIVFVRVAFTDDDYANFPARSMMGTRVKSGRPNLDDDSPTSRIHPGVTPQPSDLVVRKIRVGSFSTTDLHADLRAAGVTTLVLAGVHTSGVVLSTVREAHDLDYELIWPPTRALIPTNRCTGFSSMRYCRDRLTLRPSAISAPPCKPRRRAHSHAPPRRLSGVLARLDAQSC